MILLATLFALKSLTDYFVDMKVLSSKFKWDVRPVDSSTMAEKVCEVCLLRFEFMALVVWYSLRMGAFICSVCDLSFINSTSIAFPADLY